MILNYVHSTVETEGFESRECGIEHNATMFRILSSSLYSDRLAAVLREVSCNAYDAQIQAGRPHDAIHVELPTYINETLTISDNGIGLKDGFDPAKSDTLGMQLVCALAGQLRGTVAFQSAASNRKGTRVIVTFAAIGERT